MRRRVIIAVLSAALGTGSALAVAACGEDRGGVEVEGGTGQTGQTGATTEGGATTPEGGATTPQGGGTAPLGSPDPTHTDTGPAGE